MNIFSSKPKVPKAPYFVANEPDVRHSPSRPTQLRPSRSTSYLPYMAEEGTRTPARTSPRAREAPPVPQVPSQYAGGQSSYHRAPLQGDRAAVMPNTVTRQLTPPAEYYEDPLDEPPEQEVEEQQPTPSLENAQDTWVDEQYWSPHARGAMARTQQAAAAKPTPEPEPPAPVASSSRAQYARYRSPAPAATPPASPTIAATAPLQSAVQRTYPAASLMQRPAPGRSPSSYMPPPVQICDMRVHSEPMQGRPNSFQIEMRFELKINAGTDQRPDR